MCAGKAGERDFAVMIETVQGWLSATTSMRMPRVRPACLAPLAEVGEKPRTGSARWRPVISTAARS